MNAEPYAQSGPQVSVAEPPIENAVYQSVTSVSISFSILRDSGMQVKGDFTVQRISTVPRRASRPVQQPTPITVDDDYDVAVPGTLPRSQLRYRPTSPQQPTTTRTTEQLAPKQTHQFSRMWLVLLPALVAILFVTALPGLQRQWHTGDHNTQEWTINSDEFTSWVNNGQVNILVLPHGDASKAQLLPSKVVGYHTSSVNVELMQQQKRVLVFINNTEVGQLVPNGQGGYKWM